MSLTLVYACVGSERYSPPSFTQHTNTVHAQSLSCVNISLKFQSSCVFQPKVCPSVTRVIFKTALANSLLSLLFPGYHKVKRDQDPHQVLYCVVTISDLQRSQNTQTDTSTYAELNTAYVTLLYTVQVNPTQQYFYPWGYFCWFQGYIERL